MTIVLNRNQPDAVVMNDNNPVLVFASGAPGGKGPPGSDGILPIADRTDLAAIASPSAGDALWLAEQGRVGAFQFSSEDLSTKVAADTAQGLYVAPAADPTGASGAWVRQFDGPLNPMWFGLTEGNAAGANGAANSAALAAMFAAMETRAVNPIGDHRGLETIRFPAGYFEFDETIDITGGARIIEGQATGLPYARTTILKFPAGVTGIRVQAKDTSGAEGEDAVDHFSGGATVVRGLTLLGAFVDTEAEAHGVHLRSAAIVENCFIGEFEGDGIYANASALGVPLGNANNSIVRDSRIEFCRNGLYVDGTDANIWLVSHVDTSLNRQWGVWDRSFLGNTYIACHSASNGRPIGTAPGSTVSHGGNRYAVNVDEEAGASTNAPTGAATDNQWWHWLAVGGADSNNPAWVSGTTYRAGGVAATDSTSGRNVFSGCYAETGQGMAQFVEPTLVIGGMLAHHMRAGSGYLTGTGGITVGGDKLAVAGPVEARTSGTSLGPVGGAAADSHLYIENTNLISRLNFRRWVAGVGTIDGYIGTAGSGGTAQLRINHSTTIVWRIADTAKGRITATELRPETDNAMDLGLTGTRWKGLFAYTGDFTTSITVAGRTTNLLPNIQTVASAATVTPTFLNDQVNITAQAAALQLANPTGTAVPDWGIVIRIKDNGTARAISYDTQYRAIGVTLPTTTVIGKTLYLGMIWNATDSKWDVVSVAQEV